MLRELRYLLAAFAIGIAWGNVAVGDDPLFAAAVHYSAGEMPHDVAIGNVNGDSIPD